jgi:hypothetical protein
MAVSYTRLTAVWSGLTGLPGYSHFAFAGQLTGTALNTAATAIRAFLVSPTPTSYPSGLKLDLSAVVEYRTLDGKLDSVASVAPWAQITGTGSGGYAGGSGAVVHWNTGVYHNGRQVRGSTFLVPLNGSVYSTDGTLSPTVVSAIQSGAAAFIATADVQLVVHSMSVPTGDTVPILSATVPDRSAFMRSRRQ